MARTLTGEQRNAFLDANSIPEPNSGCYIWEGLLDSKGYGRSIGRKLAHRIVYEREFGAIPKGMDLHHKCRLRCCVNTAHMEVLTRSEHKLIHAGNDNSKYTCKRGHDQRVHGSKILTADRGLRIMCNACRVERRKGH